MARLNSMLFVACILMLPMMLGSCAGALIVGGLAAAGGGSYAAAQERGVSGAVGDFALQTGVERVVSYVELRPGAPLAAQPDKPATGLAPRGAASSPLDRLPFASEVVLSEVADMYAAC